MIKSKKWSAKVKQKCERESGLKMSENNWNHIYQLKILARCLLEEHNATL